MSTDHTGADERVAPRRKPSPSGGELVAVWTRQYIRKADIGGRIHMTDERMTKLVNDARIAGFHDGVNAGRHDLRTRLDDAGCRCDPIGLAADDA